MNLWGFKARFYDSARKIFPFNVILTKESANIKNLLSKIDLNDGRILDVGTGCGASVTFFGESGQTFAIDSSWRMVEKARLKGGKNFIVADAFALPIKSDSFNLITAVGLLEYQKEKVVLLKEFQRVVVPTGYFLLTYSQISLLNRMRFLWGHRIYLLSSDEFVQLVKESEISCLDNQQSLIQTQALLRNHA